MRQCVKWTLRGQQRGEERVRHNLATEMVLEQLDIMRKISLDTDLTLFAKTDSQWTTDLNVKYETTELLEDVVGENLEALGVSTTFQIQHQRYDPQNKELVDFIKIKVSVLQRHCRENKKTIQKLEENICKTHIR